MKKFMLLSYLLMLAFSVSVIVGCEDDPKDKTIDNRSYGPPMNDIAVVNYSDNSVFTVSDEALSLLLYFHSIGNATDIKTPGFGVEWRSGSRSENEIVFYEEDADRIVALDQDGIVSRTYDGALPYLYQMDEDGERVAFVRNISNDLQVLYTGKLPGAFASEDVVDTLLALEEFASKPSISIPGPGLIKGVVSVRTTGSTLPTKVHVYNTFDDNPEILEVSAFSPTLSNDPTHFAYINVSNTEAISLHIASFESLIVETAINLPVANANNLIWSPDDSKIALYSGITQASPTLYICDVASGSISELVLEGWDIALAGAGDDFDYFSKPDWNAAGDKLVLCVEDPEASGKFAIITTDLDGTTITKVVGELAGPCRPSWNRYIATF